MHLLFEPIAIIRGRGGDKFRFRLQPVLEVMPVMLAGLFPKAVGPDGDLLLFGLSFGFVGCFHKFASFCCSLNVRRRGKAIPDYFQNDK